MPRKSFNIGFLVYEFTTLPSGWVENINKYLNLIFVPSDFCRDIFINSGVTADKLKVLRYGFNPEYYYPAKIQKYTEEPFTFLCVANPHKREGIEFLLNALSLVFNKKDNVKLVLKLSYLPEKNTQNFEYKNISDLIRNYSGNIELINSQLTEDEMGALYRRADCYVSMSRAEAYGLCFLEAVACGIPVISLRYSGQAEFLSEQNSYFVKHKMVRTRGEEYQWIDFNQRIAKPDLKHAGEVIEHVFRLRCEGRLINPVLQPYKEYFYWNMVAREFLEKIGSL